ncbi:hypothetical protein SFA32_12540 [Buttiauxella sp. HR94]|nr:hypothetical protein SFA32_12540 [Buttiauxella sp. HR94]
MTIEKAKAELHAAMSGAAGRQWSYGPAISAVLAALGQAEQRIAELEARIEPQDPIAWIVHARTGDRLTQDGDYVANAEGIDSIHSTPLYAAPPVSSLAHLRQLVGVVWNAAKESSEVPATSYADQLIAAVDWQATPAQPVAVPDEITERIGGLDWGWQGEFNRGWNACRAVMLQSFGNSEQLEPVSQPYKLVCEVVAWDHPTKERSVDFRWLNYDVAPGTQLYAIPRESE